MVYLLLLSLFRNRELSSLAAIVLAAGCFGVNIVVLRRDKMPVSELGIISWQGALDKFSMGLFGGTLLLVGWLLIVELLLRPHWSFDHIFRGNGSAASRLVLLEGSTSRTLLKGLVGSRRLCLF